MNEGENPGIASQDLIKIVIFAHRRRTYNARGDANRGYPG
jgi:hypothetical protein